MIDMVVGFDDESSAQPSNTFCKWEGTPAGALGSIPIFLAVLIHLEEERGEVGWVGVGLGWGGMVWCGAG